MTFREAIATCHKKYATFEGRASRSEFWWFYLYLLLFGAVAIIIDLILGASGIIYSLGLLAYLVPYFSCAVRRLHDIDKSGWWLLIMVIPFAAIVLLVWYVMEGSQGENRFGSDPLL